MIKYKLFQNKNANSSNFGKWYGRVATTETTDLDTLAERIQRNCTVKKSDVKAVLTELTEVMQDELQASHRVKLNGFGSFRAGLVTKLADTQEKFTSANIVGLKVVFQPELRIAADGTRTRTFLTGAKVGPLETAEKTSATASGDTTTGGDTQNP